MNISFNWLQDYVTIHESPGDIADRLTMGGLEVESVRSMREVYRDFVVGSVRSAEKHPNADRLTVCQVYDGRDTHTVVCGAPNVAAGQKIVFARVGAVVPVNAMEVRTVEIRGLHSSGMICSEYELEAGTDHEGILVLPVTAKPGTPFSKFYWHDDVVFSVGITPNRPDCLSHIGVAREVAALCNRKLRLPSIRIRESGVSVRSHLKISIEDPDHCPRYVGRLLDGVSIEPSPDSMQRRLKAVGIRPINAVVDATNYVLMEYGQPLHAFDYEHIAGNRIVVRLANGGERFVTLDEKERILSETDLLICDAERPVALAGVMGGLNSEIRDTTTSVMIESAYFTPSSIRNTSKKLGLSTESSYRFERGIDPAGAAAAADRAVQLIQQTAGGRVFRGRVDIYPKKINPVSVRFRTNQVERILGIRIPVPAVRKHVKSIGITVRDTGKQGIWKCTIPTHRPDIGREIDIIEEVARLHGYDAIPALSAAGIHFTSDDGRRDVRGRIREWFVGSGYREVLCNSMVPADWNGFTGRAPVGVRNPQNQDMAELRTSLIPGMINVIRHNVNRGNENLRLYEIGSIFSREAFGGSTNLIGRYHEGESIALAITGLRNHLDWSLKDAKTDFYDIKGEVESLLGGFSLDKSEYNIYHIDSNTLIDEAVAVEYQGVQRGYLGSVSRRVLEAFDIDTKVFAAEFDLAFLEDVSTGRKKYREVPKFPPVRRDLAFMLDDSVPYGELDRVIRESGRPLLQEVSLFDVYRGEKVGQGKKSIAVTMELISFEKTLTQPEIEGIVMAVVNAVREKLGGVLRS
jgi:phenylalanyl-tRNA synthetase beta chain